MIEHVGCKRHIISLYLYFYFTSQGSLSSHTLGHYIAFYFFLYHLGTHASKTKVFLSVMICHHFKYVLPTCILDINIWMTDNSSVKTISTTIDRDFSALRSFIFRCRNLFY